LGVCSHLLLYDESPFIANFGVSIAEHYSFQLQFLLTTPNLFLPEKAKRGDDTALVVLPAWLLFYQRT
jgi:hypothetical protein